MSGSFGFSGIASGVDWRNIIDQLRQLEYKKIELVQDQQKVAQDRLSTWQSINTQLLSLKTVAGKINEAADFNLFSPTVFSNTSKDPDDLLSVTAGTSASRGSYNIVINSLAAAEKLSSVSYASDTTALGLSGDIIVGGRTVAISATDTLSSLRDKINAVNTGTNASKVTASVVHYGTNDYRLTLTSDEEGEAGISLLNGGATDLVGTLGFLDSSREIAKNPVTGGNQSDAFSAADKAIGGADLLNLTSPQSGTVSITIDGTTRNVAINLATASLNTIRDSINAAFVPDPASVISETDDNGNTTYRLLIQGNTISYTDANNILETLGILEAARETRGVTGDIANLDGGPITSNTKIVDIDGYSYVAGDTIALTGTSTSGAAVNFNFSYNNGTRISALLTEINNRYGNVTATVTADGKIQVIDNELEDTHLVVNLNPSAATLNFDTDNNFGAIYAISFWPTQAGADASFTVDGVAVTRSSNTVDDLITGVTLNLKGADPATTLTVNVNRDYEGLEEQITEFVTAYNDLMDTINEQLTYDTATQSPGGPLYGDSTLRALRSSLLETIVNQVPGLDENFSTLGLVGINLDNGGKLTIDSDTLQGYLETNFEDVKNLFVASATSTNGSLTYVDHNYNTQAGTYNINITGVSPVAGYFSALGDASGSGEYLTGISGNAKGLVVRYSGIATGSIGSMTIKFGVAELLDRSLYQITDSTYGYMSGKQEAIQDTITDYDETIATMEARLEKKMEELEASFITMEIAMSSMQSLSSWLTGQIKSMSSIWG